MQYEPLLCGIIYMDWYVLIAGKEIARNLNKREAFNVCVEYSKKNPKIDSCRILMCRIIRRNGETKYSKASFEEYSENGIMS